MSTQTAFVTLLLLGAVSEASAQNATALAQQHGCMACHSIDHKVVGPAFADIAARYKGNANAQASLVQSIRNGSQGKWGGMAMPPNVGVDAAQAGQLATWILNR